MCIEAMCTGGAAGNLSGGLDSAPSLRAAASYAVASGWSAIALPATATKPLPRYEHASALLGDKLYCVGGNYSGRYLCDMWALDLETMAWNQVPTRMVAAGADAAADADAAAEPAAANEGVENGGDGDSGAAPAAASDEIEAQPLIPLPPLATGAAPGGVPALAGHTLTPWGDATLIALGGHCKPKGAPAAMPARVLDPTGSVADLSPSGVAPPPRGGHTAVLIRRRLYVFGGEDPHRRALGDLWCLDLDDMAWVKPATTGRAPPPRSAHAAASYDGRYMLLFGGGSVATCFSDLHVLDTHAQPMQWSQPFVGGAKVSPRAGHSSVVVGSTWYIVGGGNNVKGCTDMLGLDLRGLTSGGPLQWHSVGSIAMRDPLSSEGSSLLALPYDGGDRGLHVLLSFGGYNGKYHNAVSVMRVPGSLPDATPSHTPAKGGAPAPKTGAAKPPAAVAAAIKAAAVPAAAPAPPPTPQAPPQPDLTAQLEAANASAEAALKEAAAAKESASSELSLLRSQLEGANAAAAGASKGWEDCKASLVREREKSMKLEVEIAELRKKLAAAAEVQREVEALRRDAKEAEAKKGGSGIWGYVSGQ
ncbi:hypothetical protein FOA52_010535 [Chlamydomonas sp. UWO 241]|nr:hypothetical protein FOA52_010535 [Chlamydomonas sp. UWO 241]